MHNSMTVWSCGSWSMYGEKKQHCEIENDAFLEKVCEEQKNSQLDSVSEIPFYSFREANRHTYVLFYTKVSPTL